MIIRPAHASDQATLQRCAELAYARYIPAIGRKPAPMLDDYAAQIAAGAAHVALSTGGMFLGFIVFYAEGGHMLLENVAVLPSAAGRGVGKALIAYCENAARELGLRSVRLYTNQKMSDNLAIYPRLGYVEVERRCEGGFSRVYFEKGL